MVWDYFQCKSPMSNMFDLGMKAMTHKNDSFSGGFMCSNDHNIALLLFCICNSGLHFK